MGYGNGTFNGTVPLVVTMGYGIEDVSQDPATDNWIELQAHGWTHGTGHAPQVVRDVGHAQTVQANNPQ